MSSSASPGVRLVCWVIAGSVLAVPTSAHAQGGTETEPDAPGPAAVDTAPIHDLNTPVQKLSPPVQDLTVATRNEDGSVTDAENSEERTVTLAADVLFEFDEADITDEADGALEEAARVLDDSAEGTTVEIDGYTDAKGSAERNQELSEERAEAVEEELSSRTEGSDITFDVTGHGSADPVAPNEVDGEDNPEGREKNRRVEIRIPR
ncbi:outer membrane protein OmpA-like peptidoglycan-associated protein [Haloactinospora alba]|uniref:Outer membrane protein OmpA-like peptidoglycan-associated protein n=1 Tax=Haloactinospora alba TaxID=405555 RepID=A0A543NGP1_9ACTN|nr:OmpA family protein [Haloactinospora alba]TQN31009.1 outer membrane protein OmpA-like peptidoglycan-associated protein [Haloactinospora alba]